jgi:sec-independent protein translocase protein TatA
MDLLSPWHLLVILVIVILIFGPSKLGDVGGALGKAIKDFKKAMNDVDDAVKPAQKSSESTAPPAVPQENKPVQPS